jgi:hypothetical protein
MVKETEKGDRKNRKEVKTIEAFDRCQFTLSKTLISIEQNRCPPWSNGIGAVQIWTMNPSFAGKRRMFSRTRTMLVRSVDVWGQHRSGSGQKKRLTKVIVPVAQGEQRMPTVDGKEGIRAMVTGINNEVELDVAKWLCL